MEEIIKSAMQLVATAARCDTGRVRIEASMMGDTLWWRIEVLQISNPDRRRARRESWGMVGNGETLVGAVKAAKSHIEFHTASGFFRVKTT